MHPIQSPQNRFCVLTLDPETLPAIATTLIDVLFYSHRWAMHALHLWPHSSALGTLTFVSSIPSVTLYPAQCLRVPDSPSALSQRC